MFPTAPLFIPGAQPQSRAFGGAATEFITVQTPGSLRNNYGGHVGMKITVGASSLTVRELGRYVLSGNSGTHTVYLLDSAGNSLGSVSINTSGAPVGFKFVALGTPVTLTAGAVAFLVSSETSGGDNFYDYPSTVTATAVATVNGYAFLGASIGGVPSNGGSANTVFGYVSFKY